MCTIFVIFLAMAGMHPNIFMKIAQSSSSSSSGTKMSCSSKRAAKFLLMRVPTYRKGTTTTVMRIRPNGVLSGFGIIAPDDVDTAVLL